MTLPASLVVDVNVTANDRFPPRTGFGTTLFLQSTSITGKVDASNRTRLYGSLAEVAVDFDTDEEAYIAASVIFAQNPSPRRFKVGYYNATSATDAASMQTELNTIRDADNGFYWVTGEAALRDTTMAQGIVTWTEAQPRKFAVLASNDTDMLDDADTANIAAANKGAVQRTAVIYSGNAAAYPDVALAGVLSTFALDQAGSSYTAAFKRLRGISAEDLTQADVGAITGITPGSGANTEDGHCANVYVNIGGVDQVYGGQTLTPGVFIDEIHFRDWLSARTEEQIVGVFANNNKVAYTDQGMAMLKGAVREVMAQALRNGGLAADIDPSTGEYEPAYEIDQVSIFDVTEAQRKSRVAPDITVRFRYSGAVHFATINYRVRF